MKTPSEDSKIYTPMSKNIFCDTSIIIEYLRVTKKSGTMFHKIFIAADNLPVINELIIAELWAGKSMDKAENLLRVSDLISRIGYVAYSPITAKITGEIIRKAGKQLAFQDMAIAASAIEHDITLLTFNTKHFRKIPELELFPID